LDATYRRDGGKVLAALIRTFGDFDRAEDALQDAMARALATWPRDGVPENPAAWLLTVARRLQVDKARRDRSVPLEEVAVRSDESSDLPAIPDERLRLLFTCCHPAISQQAQVALALRTLGGLTTREIARAFVEPEPTAAQRIVRAKQKIREAWIPFELPGEEDLPDRLAAVLEVIYLVFNEGYAATEHPGFLRRDLCEEAARLARLVVELMPGEAEPRGLLALALLHHARRATRLGPDGAIVPLEEQDRSVWDRLMIEEGVAALDAALPMRRPGPYQIQAAIAALHATAATPSDTDWPQIAALYGSLLRFHPTPVVQLNAAVAHALAGNFDSGLDWIVRLESEPELKGYYLLPAAKADLLRRAGKREESEQAYRAAIPLATTEAERKYLERRYREVTSH
jgi:RNA polymerase sigma-70 factor (ECF subfamily)